MKSYPEEGGFSWNLVDLMYAQSTRNPLVTIPHDMQKWDEEEYYNNSP